MRDLQSVGSDGSQKHYPRRNRCLEASAQLRVVLLGDGWVTFCAVFDMLYMALQGWFVVRVDDHDIYNF